MCDIEDPFTPGFKSAWKFCGGKSGSYVLGADTESLWQFFENALRDSRIPTLMSTFELERAIVFTTVRYGNNTSAHRFSDRPYFGD